MSSLIPSAADWQITPCPPNWQQSAAELLLCEIQDAATRKDRAAALLEHAAQANYPLGLWALMLHNQLRGAVWLMYHAGRTAGVLPPQAYEVPDEWLAKLLQAAIAEAWQQQTVLLHALVPLEPPELASWWLENGFQSLGELWYLDCLTLKCSGAALDGPLQWVAYRPEWRQRLAQVVKASYQDTLDLPLLNGVRDVQDVLNGYQAQGQFDPARWLIAERDGQDVGCLLLADHPTEDAWEMVYMGLIPAARGHGWGRQLIQHAQQLTQRAGRRRLFLGVDRLNLPALHIYQQAGFRLLSATRAIGLWKTPAIRPE